LEISMFKACVIRVGRLRAAVLAAAWVGCAQFAVAQSSTGSFLPSGLLPMLGIMPPSSPAPPYQPQVNAPRREPLARLVENPDQTEGVPPYALTDQTGAIQRYVEPVPGIDLKAYVGQVISVRNDTGTTLLASQLNLPPQPFRPMGDNSYGERYATAIGAERPWRGAVNSNAQVELVQYVDNDDASVQLLPDDVSISDGDPSSAGRLMPLDEMSAYGNRPVYADQMGPPGVGGPMYGSPYQQMPYPPGGMMAYPNQMGPYPNSGPYQSGPNCGADGAACNSGQPNRARLSADVELLLLRPQVEEDAIGKLSEKYEFSPRFILGLRGLGNMDGRVRFWHYDRNIEVNGTNNDVDFQFDVLDIEALHRFAARRSEVTLAAGVRLAGIHLTNTNDEMCSTDLIGLTLAADGLTPLGLFPGGHVGLVYGGRLSILGGDWGGENGAFIDDRVRNDNVLVQELYGGVEIARRIRAMNVHARLLFEMQNWRSDVLAEGADIQSIGFFGPGLQIGAEF
jgi:hypothetical protein